MVMLTMTQHVKQARKARSTVLLTSWVLVYIDRKTMYLVWSNEWFLWCWATDVFLAESLATFNQQLVSIWTKSTSISYSLFTNKVINPSYFPQICLICVLSVSSDELINGIGGYSLSGVSLVNILIIIVINIFHIILTINLIILIIMKHDLAPHNGKGYAEPSKPASTATILLSLLCDGDDMHNDGGFVCLCVTKKWTIEWYKGFGRFSFSRHFWKRLEGWKIRRLGRLEGLKIGRLEG